MPAQLSLSDPATFEIYQRRAAWQHHSRPLPIYCAFLTLSDAHDSDATSARTPATYAKTLSNHSASYKRLQPARQPFTNPAATCAAAAAQEQRKRSRSSLHQLASSADLTASAPRLRGGSYVTYGRQMTSHIDSSDFRFRGSVRKRTRRSSSKSNSQCEEDTNARSSGSTYARGCARRVRQSAIIASTRNSIHDTRSNVRGTCRLIYSRAASIKRFTHTRAAATAPLAHNGQRWLI
ncbi:hypothetical protein EDB85DRAFT_1894832 [Lactarius pseudohatsudake]|nr:hypothetical protein EDB85DRAFT_1894832 [Lactarius pseudohatsudake]